ncbi:MAG TPA: hypothetical protein VMU29_10900 [Smithella sp.]|nr:hypothetical protein [Smithella sp.]
MKRLGLFLMSFVFVFFIAVAAQSSDFTPCTSPDCDKAPCPKATAEGEKTAPAPVMKHHHWKHHHWKHHPAQCMCPCKCEDAKRMKEEAMKMKKSAPAAPGSTTTAPAPAPDSRKGLYY